MLAVIQENHEGPSVVFSSADDGKVERVFVAKVNEVFHATAQTALEAEEIADQNNSNPVKLYLTKL